MTDEEHEARMRASAHAMLLERRDAIENAIADIPPVEGPPGESKSEKILRAINHLKAAATILEGVECPGNGYRDTAAGIRSILTSEGENRSGLIAMWMSSKD